jgi:coenzyme F420 biosynthesis associated uncharacterized protein
MGGVIDWKLATTVAENVSNLKGGTPDGAAYEHVAGPAEEAAALVSAYTGLVAAELPHAEPVDRPLWIQSNLTSLRTVLDPVSERLGQGAGPLSGVVGAVGGTVLAVEVGAVSGVLAQRVLGQYEFPILEPDAPARLLFVSPNLAVAADALHAESDELLRWVALHEITHALQFGGVPWLRPHVATLVSELLGGLDVDPTRLLKMPDTSDLRSLVDKIRDGDLATLIVGPERRAALDEMQAFMAVLEGYAEHVMDAVGADVLPDLPKLRTAMDRRRRDRSGLMRIFEKLIGMDLKLRQYELGKQFCDHVANAGGIAALNRVWEEPAQMPTLAELSDPDAWLGRTGPARAA